MWIKGQWGLSVMWAAICVLPLGCGWDCGPDSGVRAGATEEAACWAGWRCPDDTELEMVCEKPGLPGALSDDYSCECRENGVVTETFKAEIDCAVDASDEENLNKNIRRAWEARNRAANTGCGFSQEVGGP